ncbi:hypothetical protein [Kurthia sp. Dielmo]|uniref:hypothetical protein n=1 Tax=Kurthia sp. Dielmo TaxID=1033738 RepID=UPI00111DB639|nr:hypothetical protein [Kurthia sp. Dielmo]
MYIQSNGVIQKKNNKLIFKKDNNTGFEIEGAGADTFCRLFPYLTGTVPVEEILQFVDNIEKNEILHTFRDLEENEIVSIKEKSFIKICIVSESLSQNELEQLFDNPILNDSMSFENIENLERESADIVIAVDYDENKLFFQNINNQLKTLQIPWLKYSFDDSKLFMGPIFFQDGGPCYECFNTRLTRNTNYDIWNMSAGNVKRYLAPIIEKELLKLSKSTSPTLCFNTEIVFDTLNLEITKYPVFKLPNCKSCGDEYYE